MDVAVPASATIAAEVNLTCKVDTMCDNQRIKHDPRAP